MQSLGKLHYHPATTKTTTHKTNLHLRVLNEFIGLLTELISRLTSNVFLAR
jgi:hypothetical protein